MKKATNAVVMMAFVVVSITACEKKAVPGAAARDSGAGNAPEPEYASVVFGLPDKTTSNWSPALAFVVLSAGRQLHREGKGDLVTSLVSLTDLSTGQTVPTKVQVSATLSGEEYVFVPVDGLRENSGYRFTLTPNPAEPLTKVFWGLGAVEVTSGTVHADVFTFSKPIVSTVGIGPQEGKTVVGIQVSEDYRLNEMTAGPKPLVILDDVEMDACVDPVVECRDVGFRSYEKLPIGEGGEYVEVTSNLSFYLSENFADRFEKVAIRIPKNVRGIEATFEEGARGNEMAVVLDEFVEYTFFVNQAVSLGSDTYWWHF